MYLKNTSNIFKNYCFFLTVWSKKSIFPFHPSHSIPPKLTTYTVWRISAPSLDANDFNKKARRMVSLVKSWI